MRCRHCAETLRTTFVDLGTSPPSNAYLTLADAEGPELWFPLEVMVCTSCWLVQTRDHAGRDQLFTDDYAYFSSVSRSWLRHSERYVGTMIERFGLDATSTVVEVAANDGYLLQYVKARGIPCYGIEPTRSTADAARERGLEIIGEFFGVDLARKLAAEGRRADLTAANNVLAHVPDINDFVGGFAELLATGGVSTFEFPHLLRLVENNQFDTIYHEHYSYLSLSAVQRVFDANGLRVFDVETLSTHGGSLRVFAERSDGDRERSAAVAAVLAEEMQAGIETEAFYAGFQRCAERVRNDLLSFLIEAQREGRRVVAYGAAAKGNTLLNFAGVRRDLVEFVCDAAPSKQGRLLPGSRIPIFSPDRLRDDRPDYVLILPWNIADEIREQLADLGAAGVRFVTAVPELRVDA